jgi:hypothetical protein
LQILGLGTAPVGSTEVLMQSWIASGLGFALNHIEEALGNLDGPDQVHWLNRVEAERNNLRRALQRSRELPGAVGKTVRLGQVVRRVAAALPRRRQSIW